MNFIRSWLNHVDTEQAADKIMYELRQHSNALCSQLQRIQILVTPERTHS